MIADRAGTTTGYALDNLQARGEFFVGPGEAVYEGMVVGENAKPDDMIVNVVREKQKTNIRTHAADEAIKLTPPRVLTLETGIEFIADDELVEVTPDQPAGAQAPAPRAGSAPPEALTARGQPVAELDGPIHGPVEVLLAHHHHGAGASRTGPPGGPRPAAGSGSCRRSGTSTSS